MLRPRSSRYPMLQAYFATRPKPPLVQVASPKTQTLALAGVSAFSGLSVLGSGAHLYVAAGLLAVGGGLAYVGLMRTKPAPPPTPEQELTAKANVVVRQIDHQIEFNRLHRVFHPAVVATLEECAGFYARIVAALDEGHWDHRPELRENALAAANAAMDEAIIHAGKTLPFVPPAKPLDQLSDTLEDIGFGPLTRGGRGQDPVPPSFRPVRDLAERLRELAVRCETAATQRREESPETVSAAFRRLDATLGEMRQVEEAESELRQGA